MVGRTTRRRNYAAYGLVLAIVAVFATWIPLIVHRGFDADEFEHSHAAWCVFRGMVPYRDFFEHHTPWYYYVLRPFFHWFDVAKSVESARGFLLFGRALSMALSVVSALLVVWIGQLWDHRKTGLWAAFLLVTQPFFTSKGVEIRPDVLALPLFLGSLGLLVGGLGLGTESARKAGPRFLAGGSCLGAAIMCTQKMLFVLPGALVALAAWSVAGARAREALAVSDAPPGVRAPSRLLLALAFLAGVVVPVVLTWALFAMAGAGTAFIANNFLLNAQWKHFATGETGKLVAKSWPVLALALWGSAVSLRRFFRPGQRPYSGLLLLCTMVGLFAGLLVMPVAFPQYYLIPMPILCLFAAKGLLFLLSGLRKYAGSAGAVLALILLSVLPALDRRDSVDYRNDGQLARMRYVFQKTKPNDLVMDGWQGTGVFRPHAFFYFFLHPETVAMLPGPRLEAYLVALERGEIRPAMVALDGNLVSLGSRFLRFVQRNYVTNDGFLYFPRGSFRFGEDPRLRRSPPLAWPPRMPPNGRASSGF